jgi:hypothetical protein
MNEIVTLQNIQIFMKWYKAFASYLENDCLRIFFFYRHERISVASRDPDKIVMGISVDRY